MKKHEMFNKELIGKSIALAPLFKMLTGLMKVYEKVNSEMLSKADKVVVKFNTVYDKLL